MLALRGPIFSNGDRNLIARRNSLTRSSTQ